MPDEIEFIDHEKYELMHQLFLQTGKHGPWMMRNTTSIQVNIDIFSKTEAEQEIELDEIKNKSKTDLGKQKIEVEIQMKVFAEDLDFENAIRCRDKIKRIEKELQKDESK